MRRVLILPVVILSLLAVALRGEAAAQLLPAVSFTESTQIVTVTDNEVASVGGTLEEGASLIPAGLGYGDRFRLLFVTSTKRNATSTDIADYNAFVQTRAAAGHTEITAFASGFRAVASTATVDARDNSHSNTAVDGVGVPIYWLGGAKVADNYADFYDGDWDSRAVVDESGNTVDIDNSGNPTYPNGIWTGSYISGTGRSGHQLGTATPQIADLGTTSSISTPLNLIGLGSERPQLNARYFYALSPLLEYVGPELTVTGGSEVTEGKYPIFTISGTPAASGTITVSYTVTATGNFVCANDLKDKPVVSLGTKQVSFTGSSAIVRVCTKGDSIPEPDGSVTVTLNEHATYRVSSTQGSASVDVKDNDNYVPPPILNTPELSVTAGSAVTEGSAANFTINAAEAPTNPVTVDYTVTASGGYVTSDSLGAKQVTLSGASTTVAVPTTGDNIDEPNGSVTITINAGTGYTVSGIEGSDSVAVSDDDATVVTLSLPDRLASEGDSSATATLRLTLNRSLVSGESLSVPLRFSGGTVGTDCSLVLSGSPTGVSLSGSTVTFTGPSAISADVVVSALDDEDASNERVSVSIPTSSSSGTPRLAQTGLGTVMGIGPTNPWLLFEDDDEVVSALAAVSVTAGTSPVTEGAAANFTINVLPAPTSAITVSYTIIQIGSYVTSSHRGSKTVQIDTSGTVTVSVPTIDDNFDEPNGSVTITVNKGIGYVLGSPSLAIVIINDNDTSGGDGGGGTPPLSLPPSLPPSPPPSAHVPVVDHDHGSSAARDRSPVWGLWGEGQRLYAVEDKAVVAPRALDSSIHETVVDLVNPSPRGLWSDGEIMWVADAAQDELFAYNRFTGQRAPERDLILDALNGSPWGIWSDGEIMWVADTQALSLFAYWLVDSTLAGVYTLDPVNAAPHDLWSDGATIWVADSVDIRVYAYELPVLSQTDTVHSALKLVGELVANQCRVPRNIWADTNNMYIWAPVIDNVHVYDLPSLLSLELTHADIAARDALIAQQENLLNEYRCLFNIDTHIVPGGCTNN